MNVTLKCPNCQKGEIAIIADALALGQAFSCSACGASVSLQGDSKDLYSERLDKLKDVEKDTRQIRAKAAKPMDGGEDGAKLAASLKPSGQKSSSTTSSFTTKAAGKPASGAETVLEGEMVKDHKPPKKTKNPATKAATGQLGAGKPAKQAQSDVASAKPDLIASDLEECGQKVQTPAADQTQPTQSEKEAPREKEAPLQTDVPKRLTAREARARFLSSTASPRPRRR